MRMADIPDESALELDFTIPRMRVPKQVEDEPIEPSACPVCKAPTKRSGALCAQCRVPV